jgi:hypothetical protein
MYATPDPHMYIDNLTNLTNNTFYKAFDVFFTGFGKDIFFTILFSVIAIGILISSKHQTTTLIIYLLAVDVFCAVLLAPIALLVFGLVTAFLGGGALYRSLVSKR